MGDMLGRRLWILRSRNLAMTIFTSKIECVEDEIAEQILPHDESHLA